MVARIYKPARTAMQSGPARTKEWVLEHEPQQPRQIDPLMGWTSSRDTRAQIRLEFATRDEAIAYLQTREAELSNQLSQTEAELTAAMDGLRDARQEAEELRAWIERNHPALCSLAIAGHGRKHPWAQAPRPAGFNMLSVAGHESMLKPFTV